MPMPKVNRRAMTQGLQLSLRAAVAAGLSLALAQAFALEYPIYAFLGAVIVTDLSPSTTRQLGLRRIVATVVGAACGAALGPWLQSGPWAIALGILVAMSVAHLVRAREGAKVAGYICGIVMLTHGSEPWSYACFRLVETMLGIAVAWSISLVPKLLHPGEPAPGSA